MKYQSIKSRTFYLITGKIDVVKEKRWLIANLSLKKRYPFLNTPEANIAEQTISGQSIKSFCTKHGIQAGNWFYWQKRYQQRNHQPHNDNGNFTLLQIAPEAVVKTSLK